MNLALQQNGRLNRTILRIAGERNMQLAALRDPGLVEYSLCMHCAQQSKLVTMNYNLEHQLKKRTL